MSAMSNLDLRFSEVCRRCRNLRMATRLWNWIDNQAEPEGYWHIMVREIPWAFRSSHPNSMRFVYRSRKHDAEFAKYARTRKSVNGQILMLSGWLRQVSEVVKAIPETSEEAGYLDLDVVNQLDAKLGEVLSLLCNDTSWEDLSLARSAVGLKG